jgi:hypothetical protein
MGLSPRAVRKLKRRQAAEEAASQARFWTKPRTAEAQLPLVRDHEGRSIKRGKALGQSVSFGTAIDEDDWQHRQRCFSR